MRLLSNIIHAGQYSISQIPAYSGQDFDTARQEEDPAPAEGSSAEDQSAEDPPAQSQPDGGLPAGNPPDESPPAQSQPAESPQQEDNENQVKQILEKAFLRAKQIMDSAQDYSDGKMQEARETIARESAEAKKNAYSQGFTKGSEQGRKDGYDAGYGEGLQEGRKQAEAENRKKLDELGTMMKAVEKSKTKILNGCEEGVQDLAKTMAKAILRRELGIDEKAMQSIIVSAMEEYRNQAWIRIYVSRKTASGLIKTDNNIVEALKDISDSVKVVSSSGLNDEACILETPDQVIDAGIDSQLDKLDRGVGEAMRTKQSQ